MDIAAEGAQRFEIIQVNQERSFLQAEVAFFDDEPSMVSKSAADTVIQLHEQLFAVMGQTVEVDPRRGLSLFPSGAGLAGGPGL